MRNVGSRRFGKVELVMLSILLIWGLNTPALKIGLMYLPPLVFNALRLTLGAMLSLVALALSKTYRPMPLPDLKILATISVLGFFLNQVFVMFGLVHTTAGNASLLFATLPVEVAIINRILKIEPISRRMALGIVVGLLGVFLIVWGSDKELSLSGPHLAGGAMLLVGQFCYAFYTVFFNRLTNNYSLYQVIALVLTISAALFWVIAWPDFVQVEWENISAAAWYSVLFSAVLALSFANLVWIWAVGKLGPTKASLYQYLCPIVSIAFAWVYMDETFGYFQLIGATVTFFGLYLTRRQEM
jgi:O-acetylserine/cysteine efflux transporter